MSWHISGCCVPRLFVALAAQDLPALVCELCAGVGSRHGRSGERALVGLRMSGWSSQFGRVGRMCGVAMTRRAEW
eukprot:6018873-Alexandrium_andersonii.AAC.1